MSSFGVVLDACVLIPATLRDTLLRAVEKSMYRLHWSDEILDEVRRNLVKREMISPEDAQDLIQQVTTLAARSEYRSSGESSHLFYLNPTLVMEILSEQASDLNDPPLTVPDVLEILEIVAPAFVKSIESGVYQVLPTGKSLRY